VRSQYLKHSPVPTETVLGVTRPIVEEWNVELDDRRVVPFWIEDGTGRALVLADDAAIAAPPAAVEVAAAMRGAVNAFLDRHSVIRAPKPEGARMTEESIAPGDLVEIVGPVRHEPLERATGYRDSATPTLVFFGAEGPEGALTIQKVT
jgi:hypothetical protein